MKTVIPVASGKGGVGKSIFVANLGVCLAQAGKTVIVVDLDLGGSNLHTCLGVRNSNAGIGQYIYDKDISLEQLVLETEQRKLFIVPGDSLLPGTANLSYFRKLKLMKELSALVADYIILDLGAGSSFNTIDFFLASQNGILICTPETTSVLNAYSFLKGVVFRSMYRSFPPDSTERELVHSYLTSRIEGTDRSVEQLIEQLASISEASAQQARKALAAAQVRVVLNMGRHSRDIAIGGKLREIAGKNLNTDLSYIGYLPYEEHMSASIIRRSPIALLDPQAAYVKALRSVADRIISEPASGSFPYYQDDDDLRAVASAALQ
ncbi:MAG: MinD/ParA family protein [Spirochaetaceae bacterium]|nr:MAG: MinD/ParA family protein [Spirochaetaceae bacterium]